MSQSKVAVITGGTKGLGKALSFAFAKRGWKVFTTGRNTPNILALREEATKEKLPIQVIQSDVSSLTDNQALAKHIKKEVGGIDLLVHNASILGPRLTLEDYAPETFEKVLAINTTGPFHLTQALLPLLKDNAAVQFVTSGVGIVGKAKWGAYSVSKFGLEAIAQIWAAELKERGVRVYTIDPGSMRTDMRAQAYPEEDPNTLITPEDNIACFISLAEEASLAVSGERFKAKSFKLPA